jgi:uncharacterized protein (TIGR03000 family)
MYSVVLMTALTAGSATPAWHHCVGCGSSYGLGGGYDGCGCWGGYSRWSYCNMPPPNMAVLGGYGVTGGTVAPGTGAGGEELDKPKTNKNRDKETMVPAAAKLLVELPTNAKLFIDDRPVKAAAGEQTFDIPALEPGKVYFYELRIEMMRDGQPFTQTRRILVRAGQVARADFKDLESEALRTAQAK